MRILVIGAYGLIGGYVTSRLVADGHDVTGLGREVERAQRRFPTVRWVQRDFRHMDSAQWPDLLAGMDAVINCAGALQDSPRDSLRAVHADLVGSLAKACEGLGIRRLVHISAAGVETDDDPFRRAKREADDILKAADLDWIILRPGLVLAPAAYGGSALLRGLAAFPFFIPVVGADATVRIVAIGDLVEAVCRGLTVTPARLTADLVAAEATTLGGILLAMRAWLGLAPARLLVLPRWTASCVARFADALAWFGWRSSMRTAAIRQLASGVTGNPEDAQACFGLRLKGLAETLDQWPAGVQERWFARLYFAKPVILMTLVGFWASSGFMGFVGRSAAQTLLMEAGLTAPIAGALVMAGCAMDVILAALTAFRSTARIGLWGMILVTLVYLAGASLWLPGLWGDPLGPLIKAVPAAMLALAALAILDER
jgi:uncharacterized protein YbjT (DUF2867 family)